KRANLAFLRVWGCRAVVRLPGTKRKTLGEKGIDCIFVGYAEHSKAYRFYIIKPNDSVSINSIIESRDVIFDENHFSSIPRPKDIIPNSDESQRDDLSDDVPNEIPEPRKGGSYNEVTQSQDYAFWKEAIDDEIGSIMENNTWVLSDLPHGCKPLGCKWIFKRKMKVDGTVDKFKARLVIQGFRQKKGIDYFDTYAPVAHEKVYMKQLEGFVMPGNEHKVCKLVKSLHGLKQAPKQWHQKFDEVVLSSGFHLNQSDKCVYSKFDDSEGYSDASWINHVEDSSSTSEWVFLLGGGAISWASKKQTCITGSIMKFEFVALVVAGGKLIVRDWNTYIYLPEVQELKGPPM
nr:zinc finger, CCHC-type [Tanacetum cinerariifolium]